MLLITWNVNSLRARMPRLLELLELHQPDLVCLQETKVADFPELELRAAGYGAVHHSAGRWNGVAILAREPLELEAPAYGLPGEPFGDQARWVEASAGGTRVASVYVPNGRSPDSQEYEAKLAFFEAAVERARELAGGQALIAGDLNVCRTDLDVYDPAAFVGATHVTAPERERFEAILEAGFSDAFRELHPQEPGFTWWDYRAGHFHKKLGLRIDYALLSAELAGGLRSCGIDRNFRKGPKPSDHAPLLTEL